MLVLDGVFTAATTHSAFARVEKQVGERTRVIFQALPATFERNARVEFEDVPNGVDYYVVAELRPTESCAARGTTLTLRLDGKN